VLPATQDLVGAELQLVERPRREAALRAVLDPLQADYDYIVVDCPPSLGLLTLNVLAAANTVLIPIQCEYYGLEGISQLLNTVRLVQQNFNPGLAISGVLLTMYDARLNLCRQVAEDAKEYFGAKMFVTPIPRNVRLAEAPSFGKPILLYDVQSVGAKSYLAVAQELIRRMEGTPVVERPRAASVQAPDGIAALEAAALAAAARHAAPEHQSQAGPPETGEPAGVAVSGNSALADGASPVGAKGIEGTDIAASDVSASDLPASDIAARDSDSAEVMATDSRDTENGARQSGATAIDSVGGASTEAGASNALASAEHTSADGASHDRANDPVTSRAPLISDPLEPGGAGEIASEITSDESPVALHTEATASDGGAGAHIAELGDANAPNLDSRQPQSHEPEVTT
jgi:hypothetical protein